MNWNKLRICVAKISLGVGILGIIVGIWLPAPWLFIMGLGNVILALMLDSRCC